MDLTKGGNLTDFTKLFSFASGRKRRQADETASEATSTETNTSEDTDAYYCLKHSLLG